MNSSKYKPIGKAVKISYLIIIILFSTISLITIAISIKNSISYNKMTLSILEYQNSQKKLDFLTSFVQDNSTEKYAMQNKFNDAIPKIIKSINVIKENTIDNGGNNKRALNGIKLYKEQITIYIKTFDEIMLAKDGPSINDGIRSLTNHNEFIKPLVGESISKQLNLSNKLINKMQTNFYIIIFFVIVAIIAIIIYSLYSSLKLSLSMTNSLDQLVKAAQSISKGNLSGKDIVIETNDEFSIFANAFNQMKNSLKSLVKSMHEVAYNTFYSSSELDKNIKQNLIISEQISKAISEISKRAEIQTYQMSNNAAAINNTCNIAIKIKRIINEKNAKNKSSLTKTLDSFTDDYKLISLNLIELTEKILVIKNSNDCLHELLEEFAAKSEEIASASKEQNNQYIKLEQISNILNNNAAKLDELVRNINIYES